MFRVRCAFAFERFYPMFFAVSRKLLLALDSGFGFHSESICSYMNGELKKKPAPSGRFFESLTGLPRCPAKGQMHREGLLRWGWLMARVNFEDDDELDPRFEPLVKKIGDSDMARGRLIRFWRVAQRYWGEHDPEGIPLDEFETYEDFAPLVATRWARVTESGVYAGDEKESWRRFKWYWDCCEKSREIKKRRDQLKLDRQGRGPENVQLDSTGSPAGVQLDSAGSPAGDPPAPAPAPAPALRVPPLAPHAAEAKVPSRRSLNERADCASAEVLAALYGGVESGEAKESLSPDAWVLVGARFTSWDRLIAAFRHALANRDLQPFEHGLRGDFRAAAARHLVEHKPKITGPPLLEDARPLFEP